jgi:hypothetical protein
VRTIVEPIGGQRIHHGIELRRFPVPLLKKEILIRHRNLLFT